LSTTCSAESGALTIDGEDARESSAVRLGAAINNVVNASAADAREAIAMLYVLRTLMWIEGEFRSGLI
jgi:hypothetical protein